MKLIILSYHRFTEAPEAYPFSRTYEQFEHDLRKKIYDWVTFDDGHRSIIPACEMMRRCNIRAKLFIPTALIDQENYCTSEEIKNLSRYHDIESHSHRHIRLDQVDYSEVFNNIETSIDVIETLTGRVPRYFVAPWNAYSENVYKACEELNLTPVEYRIDIRNNSK